MEKATSLPVAGVQAAAKKKAAEKEKAAASRQWMHMDGRGECMVVEAPKHVIMHRFNIHARDLRILDPLLSYPSAILGREHAIVLNLEHVKAIITAEEVLLRNPSNENVIPIVEELCRRLPMKNDAVLASGDCAEGGGMEPPKLRRLSKSRHDAEDEPPFEFRALEVALEAICSFLDARTTELETAAYPALEALTSKISSRKLDQVRKLKTAMTRLTARVQKVRDELEDLLDDDGDMAELFLTRKSAYLPSPVGGNVPPSSAGSSTLVSRLSRVSRASVGTYNADDDVEEVEMILEAYFMQIDGTLNKLVTLREYIAHTEDYINIQLDKHRNQLIQVQCPSGCTGDHFCITGASLECRNGGNGSFCSSCWNLWNEYSLYMDVWSQLHLQMGGSPHWNSVCHHFYDIHGLCSVQRTDWQLTSHKFQPCRRALCDNSV